MNVEIGRLLITCEAPALRVLALMGDVAPRITSGYGGWQEVTRPRKKALTEWQGRSPKRMILNIIVDNFQDGVSVEPFVRNLEQMAEPYRPTGQPPVIRVDGAVPKRDTEWVIEELAWGTAEYHQVQGYRIRQAAEIKLIEYVEDELVKVVSPARAARERQQRARTTKPRRPAPTARYTVKRGDTLSRIAARELNDARRWREIAKLNNLRDPDNLRVGMQLRMPQ